jgi:predicted DCC family thiol-disulfide oxidoreductase YuxK
MAKQDKMPLSFEELLRTNPKVVLFDGHCKLCSSTVQFIIQRDKKSKFRFLSLQSEKVPHILNEFSVKATISSSVILLENGRLFSHSSAALRIIKQLDGFWPCFYIFWLVPKPLRDWIYVIIARNRYRWFGFHEKCMIPTVETQARFL